MECHEFITRADRVTIMSWYVELYLFYYGVQVSFLCKFSLRKLSDIYRSWTCLGLAYGTCGMTILTSKFLSAIRRFVLDKLEVILSTI